VSYKKTMYEHGNPVDVLIKPTWGPGTPKVRLGRMNCLIRRQNGELVVRPFRGLRRTMSNKPKTLKGIDDPSKNVIRDMKFTPYYQGGHNP